MSYDRFRSLALRMLTRYGRNLTFKRVTPGPLDVATGRTAAPTIITAVGKSLVLPFAERNKYGANHLMDSLDVQESERLLITAAIGMTVTPAGIYTPLPDDEIVEQIDGLDWHIKKCETLDPDSSGGIFHASAIMS